MWIVGAIIALIIVAGAFFLFMFMQAPPDNSDGQTPGATLYAQNCASCHGSLATSSKRGRTATQIQNAIATIPQMNARLSNLNATQIQEIANALAGQ